MSETMMTVLILSLVLITIARLINLGLHPKKAAPPKNGKAPQKLTGEEKLNYKHGLEVKAVECWVNGDKEMVPQYRKHYVSNSVTKKMANGAPAVDYTITLPSEFAGLSVADSAALRAYADNIRQTHGSPRTGDANFDGNFVFTAPPHPKAMTLLENADLRAHLITLSEQIGGIWLTKSTLKFRELGRLNADDLDITAEMVSQLFMGIDFA